MSRVTLFVYGSLKRGFSHHAEMEGAHFLGEAVTATGYALYRLGEYPVLVEAGRGTVSGELFSVSREHLDRLDEFEGCPYQRLLVRLSGNGTAVAYGARQAVAVGRTHIASGVWIERPRPMGNS